MYGAPSTGLGFGRAIEREDLSGDKEFQRNSVIYIDGYDLGRWGESFVFNGYPFWRTLGLNHWRKIGVRFIFTQPLPSYRNLSRQIGLRILVKWQPRGDDPDRQWRPRHPFDPLTARGEREYPNWCYLNCYTIQRIPLFLLGDVPAKRFLLPSFEDKLSSLDPPMPETSLDRSFLDDWIPGLTVDHLVHWFPMPPRIIYEAGKLFDSFKVVNHDLHRHIRRNRGVTAMIVRHEGLRRVGRNVGAFMLNLAFDCLFCCGSSGRSALWRCFF